MQSPQRIKDHLTALYGEAMAPVLAPQFEELLRRHYAARGASDGVEPLRRLTQGDVLLITYGDQVREPGTLPLVTLARFLRAFVAEEVSGIHILPFYPSSSDDGFSVKDYYSVDPALGGWEEIAAMGGDFDLMFDAVFNHMSAQGEWFRKFLAGDPDFADFFVTVTGDPDLSRVVRPRVSPLLTEFETASGVKKVWTTFSADQADLEARNPRVLLALTEVLLFYAGKGARFVRLDAIAYLWKQLGTSCIHLPGTHEVIRFWRAILDEAAPDVRLITETNVPHQDNVSYFGNGKDEAQLVYNFALPPLVLHSLLTGRASALSEWAATLETPPREAVFFNFLASHDGIGLNPARGILAPEEIEALAARTREHGGFVSYKQNIDGSQSPYELNINFFDALSNPGIDEAEGVRVDRFIVAQSILLSLAGAPGIYFHSLFGSRGDRAGALESGIPRRINREKLRRDILEAELSDPASRRSQVLERFRKMLRVRASRAEFDPAGGQEILRLNDRIFAVRRTPLDGEGNVLCLHNVSSEGMEIIVPGLGEGGGISLLASAADGEPARVGVGGRLWVKAYAVLWVSC